VFVTGNKGKLNEVSSILNKNPEYNIPLTNELIDLPELQGTPEYISSEKCKIAVEKIKGPCIVEDTCLCFNALAGLPGPYIKFFLEGCGLDGLNKMLSAFDDKTGYALATISFTAGPNNPIHTFTGKTHGKIVPARGKDGFGWDPIFEPNEGHGKTFAELTNEEKNKISHRRRAVESFMDFLIKNPKEWHE